MRLLSLEVVGAVASFVILARPRLWAQRIRDDQVNWQALELRVEQEEDTRTIRLPLPVTIGRGADATLVIQDAQVSRMHARIDLIDGALSVRDLGSRNGTLVNARPIDVSTFLQESDEVDVGSVRIVIGGLFSWT